MDLINLILGGSLIATLTGLVTLRHTARKAQGEAKSALASASKTEAEAESVRLDNAEHATTILINNIVEPLRIELNDTRRDLQQTKREMARFRRAIEKATACHYADDCPVIRGLHDKQDFIRTTDQPDRDSAPPHHPPDHLSGIGAAAHLAPAPDRGDADTPSA